MVFGRYYKSSDTVKEDIEWIAVDTNGDEVLIVSKYCIDVRYYSDPPKDFLEGFNSYLNPMTWQQCTLRKWLNGEFYDTAFSKEEKDRIVITRVKAHKNRFFPDRTQGNDTDDKVFLLSTEEAGKYSEKLGGLVGLPTPYAMKKMGWRNPVVSPCNWWLRTAGRDFDQIVMILNDASMEGREGDILFRGGWYYGKETDNAIRPAMWIKLE